MPKPIEIEFSKVWHRKSLLRLKATEVGCYVSLIRAILIDGFDPLPTDRDALQQLSRSSRIQWTNARDRVTEALNDTMGILKRSYEKRLDGRSRISAGSKKYRQYQLDQRALTAKQPSAPVSIIDSDEMPMGMIQPHLAARYNPQDYDRTKRKQAVTALQQNNKAVLND